MAPTALSQPHEEVTFRTKGSQPAGLKPTGLADQLEFDDITPAIGREFAGVNIVDDILNGPNSDELLRDLAITISRRGVVFFRKQDNLTNDLQKKFVQRLGEVRHQCTDGIMRHV